MSNRTVVFKVSYGENTHRFSIERETISIQNVKEILGKIFGTSLRYDLKYKDNDGDLITLNSEYDLIEALKVFPGDKDVIRLQLTSKKGGPRRFFRQMNENVLKEEKRRGEFQYNSSSSDEDIISKRKIGRGGQILGRSVEDPMDFIGKMQLTDLSEWRKNFRNSELMKRVVHRNGEVDQPEENEVHAPFPPTRFGHRMHSRFGRKERITVSPSEKVTKTWNIRNYSPFVWPVGCKLTYSGGDKLTAESGFTFQNEVATKEEVEIQFTFTAPSQPGKYWTLYRMATPQGNVFGRGLKVFLEVVEKDEEEQKTAQLEEIKKPNVVVIEETAPVTETVVIEGPSPVTENVVIEEIAPVTETVEEVVTEEEKPSGGPFADLLKVLSDMGFIDEQLNLSYLENHGGDLMTVIEKLLSFK